ncbi:type IV pilin protein [Lysobacter yananisis]|uniref:Type IV pilin protein n=1 Tax=Lysobacter yananisis TaxID=1003114 RepID=A0ABY9PGH8_9GAMM|nr:MULTISPECIES: type IV pilin protein [Lysobacter]UZW63276.1 type IV pilin protein [Lysobacter enzymogenes]WMT05850.1 type IV pilin protein [Lysobacter yananisis]
MSVQGFAELHGHGRARRQAGFTLIELMIAVAIVGILAAIAYPAYDDSVRKGRRAQAKADLVELAQRAERFYTLNNTYAGFWGSVPSGDKRSPRTGNAFYLLERSSGDTDANAFTLSATPTGAQVADSGCGTLSINQAGVRSISGSMEPARCW